MTKPFNLAFGGEYRRTTYQIGAVTRPLPIWRRVASPIQAPRASDAGPCSRINEPNHIDVAVNPITALKLGEHADSAGNEHALYNRQQRGPFNAVQKDQSRPLLKPDRPVERLLHRRDEQAAVMENAERPMLSGGFGPGSGSSRSRLRVRISERFGADL